MIEIKLEHTFANGDSYHLTGWFCMIELGPTSRFCMIELGPTQFLRVWHIHPYTQHRLLTNF